MKIARVRAVVLSAPYGAALTSAENILHIPSGLRTSGFVEITLDDGTVGLGEGYLAVFAPQVFRSIVELLAPLLVGKDVLQLDARFAELVVATGYWSLQGAARHVLSAIEIALQDCNARLDGVPLWRHLGGMYSRPLAAYASGGDSINPEAMQGEIDAVAALGIRTFKIRGRAHQVDKVVWTQHAAAGIAVAVDMTQNLVVPSQRPEEVLDFVHAVVDASGRPPAFIEEALGPDRIDDLPALRAAAGVPIAGGEIVTTEDELVARVRARSYDIVQPDATVIGGVGPVLEVFSAAGDVGAEVYVHCWGAGVGVLANYHAALAAGGSTVEWPLPDYPLRSELLGGLVSIVGGEVSLSNAPGLGIELTPAIEREFPFRADAVYECLVDPTGLPTPEVWR